MKLTITILKEIMYSMIVVLCLLTAVYSGAIAAAFYYSIVNYKMF